MSKSVRRWTVFATVGLFIMGVAALGQAQEQPQYSKSQTKSQGQFNPKLVKCTDLMGCTVKNSQGEDLGTIEDLVLKHRPHGASGAMQQPGMERSKQGESGQPESTGTKTGEEHRGTSGTSSIGGMSSGGQRGQVSQIGYVVLASGGFIGIGEKYLAIPWSAFEFRAPAGEDEEPTVILNVPKEKLENAPGFDKDNWPNMADSNWGRQMDEYYGRMGRGGEEEYGRTTGEGEYGRTGGEQESMSRGTTSEEQMKLRKLSNIRDLQVVDSTGQEVGEVSDVLVDTRDGIVAYVAIDHGGEIQTDDDSDIVVVPWDSLRFQSDRELATLNIDRNRLGSIGVSEQNLRRLNDMAYARDFFRRFDQEPYWETFGYVERGTTPGMREGEQPRRQGEDSYRKGETDPNRNR